MSDFDVVLYGATGFTGRQTVAYFARHAPEGLRWAIAGRNRDKLDKLAWKYDASEVVVADSTDPASVDAMAARTRVLLTTAGPFSKYGTPVVEACVRHGTDYVDITGETPWVRRLIDRFHDQAQAGGTRIVPFCGFDSVPSDLSTLIAVEHFRARGAETNEVSASFAMKGGFNGGTLDSMLTMAENERLDELGEPLLLNPPDHRGVWERRRSQDLRSTIYDDDRKVWLAPFMMAPINTRVVRRSNALAAEYGEAYGEQFTYREAWELKRRVNAIGIALATGALDKLVRRSWARTMMRRYGPAPGQGPSERTMDNGFFRCRLVAESADGDKIMVTMSSKGDPGNRVTVTILCESALLLATAPESLPGAPDRGGVLTPATALGLPLVERLKARDFSVTVDDL